MQKSILLVVFFIMASVSAIGVNKFSLDESDIKLAICNGSYDNTYIEKGNYYQIVEDVKADKWYGWNGRSFIFLNNDILCLMLLDKILFYDCNNKSVIRKLDLLNYTYATVKNREKTELYIFSGGFIYQYNFKKDKLTELKKLEETNEYGNIHFKSTKFPSAVLTSKCAYSKSRNSIFYEFGTGHNNIIYELSLETYQAEPRFQGGKCPVVIEEHNKVYYLGGKPSQILSARLDDLSKTEVELKYKLDIWYFCMNKEGLLLFVHRSRFAMNFPYYDQYDKIFKIRDTDGKIKAITTKYGLYETPFDFIVDNNE